MGLITLVIVMNKIHAVIRQSFLDLSCRVTDKFGEVLEATGKVDKLL
jgi:hypothetical protein